MTEGIDRFFFYFEATFNSVYRKLLWIVLKTRIIAVFRLYEQIKLCPSQLEISQLFSIWIGIWQGCAAAPKLFNSTIDYAMMRTPTQLNFSLQLGDRLLSNTDFADNLTLSTTTLKELDAAPTVIREEAGQIESTSAGAKRKSYLSIHNDLKNSSCCQSM